MKKSDFDVLVIDDENDICEIVSKLLTRAGFSVKTAINAKDAEVILDDGIPPLIICDISMPEKTGLEFVAEVRERGLPCAVVMLTAHSEKERMLEALRLGCVDYVTKPFVSKTFAEHAKIWLEMGRTLQTLYFETNMMSDLSKGLMKIDLLRVKAVQCRKNPLST